MYIAKSVQQFTCKWRIMINHKHKTQKNKIEHNEEILRETQQNDDKN